MTPPYRRVVNALRARIEAGEWGPGDQLPSGRELADEYGVSAATAARAIRLLAAEKLIVTQQGWGAFVAPEECPAD